MMGRALVAVFGLAGVVACGGASADNPIASMPAYPDAKDAKAEKATTETTSAPARKDPKSICAGASADVKVALESHAPRSLDEADKASLASSSSRKSKGSYSIADLQALEKKSSWEELLLHAEDVAPAQRNAAWEKLVTQAATGYMQQLSGDTTAYEGIFTSQALVTRYPHLQKAQGFMAKREEAGKKAADRCLQDAYRGQHCIDLMTDFLKTPGTSPEAGFAFGKITRLRQNHYVAVPFFRWALDQKKDAAMCGDEDLKLAVVAGLGLPPDYENAAGARHIAATSCWEQMRPLVEKELTGEPSGYNRDNMCAVLKAKGAL